MASIGRTVCAMHGGKSLRGAEHPRFRHGRYSQDVLVAGSKLGAAFKAHANDPEFTSSRPELALLRTRISEVLSGSNGTMTDRDWAKVTAVIDAHTRAMRVEIKKAELDSENLTVKQAQALFGAMQMAVLDEVQDPEVRRRIAARMRLILTAGSHAAPGLKLLSEKPPAEEAEYEVVTDSPALPPSAAGA